MVCYFEIAAHLSCDDRLNGGTGVPSTNREWAYQTIFPRLHSSFGLTPHYFYKESFWALGEERINRVTPTEVQFREWKRNNDGLMQFWSIANQRLDCTLDQEDAHDIWE
jgi:hypothetical protein